jgi:hypothetical protein
MPVSDEHALRLIEIEAMRQITDNLKRLNEGQAEQTRTLHSIDLRLTKIESNSVNTKVTELATKVDALESDRDKRDGAITFGNWLLRYGPLLAAVIAIMIVVLAANDKL